MEHYNIVKTGGIIVTRTNELNIIVEHLCKKYNLTPSAVINYCITRVYNKEKMDEQREIDYLDGNRIQ